MLQLMELHDPANNIEKQDQSMGRIVNLVAFNEADNDSNGSVSTTDGRLFYR